jgi:hypothetical protein
MVCAVFKIEVNECLLFHVSGIVDL